MSIVKVNLVCALFVTMFYLTVYVPVCIAKDMNYIFKAHNEIKISSAAMNCNYQLEDHAKNIFNFEYPKIISVKDAVPLVAFIDESMGQLTFADIISNKNRIVKQFPGFGKYNWERWPIIFTIENKIYLAVRSKIPRESEKERIKIFLYQPENKELLLKDDIIVNRIKRCTFNGIYPFLNNYLMVGACNYICERYLYTILSTTNFPVFYHNASFSLDKNNTLEKQSIEEEGCFSDRKREYAVPTSGTIYTAWFRNTGATTPQHDEILLYSINKDGRKWEKPTELYAVKDTTSYYQLNNLSLASTKDAAFLLWQDPEKGIFFAEIRDDKAPHITLISEMKQVKGDEIDSLELASTIKITADDDGNVYALWIINDDYNYQLFFKSRINGQWAKEQIINHGFGLLKLPDMKVDKKGIVHITFIKSADQKDPRYGKFDCYYMALERKDQ
jgi:hypothetical protein